MTNAEAISRLKSDIPKYTDFLDKPNEDEFWEAFDMAIKALEQLDKIRGIVSKSEYPREDVIRYKMICDVLGVEHV